MRKTSTSLRGRTDSAVPVGRLAGAFARLFAPSPAVEGSAARRSARLLAKIAFVMAALNVWASVQTLAFAPDAVRFKIAGTLLPGSVVFALAHLLSRTRHWRMALPLLIAVQAAEPVVITSWIGTFDEAAGLTMAGWLFLAVLTGASMLPARLVVALGGVALIGLLTALVGFGGAGPDVVAHPSILLISLTLVTAVVVRHRDVLEGLRQREILLRNAELEELRRTLEDRVVERTRSLEESHAELARAFASLETNQRARIIAEKMAAIGRMTAGIVHEMASPVGAIVASLYDLDKLAKEYARSVNDAEVTPADHLEIAKEMSEATQLASTAAERCAAFLRSVRTQTREDGHQPHGRFDVVATVQDTLRLLGHVARAARVEVSASGVSKAEISGAAGRLAQAVSNLVHNAIDATGERGGGRVHVHVVDDGDGVRIDVRDEGPGIPPEILAHVFEPFFTTKPFGKGTGLGLVIVKEAVESDLGGRIEIRTEAGRGSTFVLHLPRKTVTSHAA